MANFYGTSGADVLTGGSTDDTLTAYAGNDTLIGGAGNDFLKGGVGADSMVGGAGNDLYLVDDLGDIVVESLVGDGTDGVISSISYTLGQYVENLTLSASNTIGTGNGLNNNLVGTNGGSETLIGGAGNDYLSGGAGADSMEGGIGDDVYYVENVGDIVTELSGEGTDTVFTTISYTLTANVDNLTLQAAGGNISGTGNGLNNTIKGNSGNNTLTGDAGNDFLSGGLGADTMIGGVGSDTYRVDNVGDVITELSNEGSDIVQSSVSYVLGANVENLVLLGGSGNISGTGNSINNTLVGNSGSNVLIGGAGNDLMLGGTGNDTYYWGLGEGQDTLIDSDATVGNSDILSVYAGVARDQLWFKHVNNNLEVSIIGTTNKMTVSNWYSGSNNYVEQITTATGDLLSSSNVEALVAAMAAFSSHPAGATTLTPAEHTALDSVIAASWV